ncbi:MAG: recombinase A [Polyangiaceae bacterium]
MRSAALESLLASKTASIAAEIAPRAKPLPLGGERAAAAPLTGEAALPGAVSALLPEGGLLRGGVVEIAASRGLAKATTLALAACASAQAEARLRGGGLATQGAWCGWVDTTGSLHAPSVMASGVDLARLLVVRPPPEKLAKVAVRMAESRAFSVLVVDAAGALGDHDRIRSDEVGRWATTVRRLSLAIENSDRTIVLLTDLWAQRPMVLPVAMRIEVERPSTDRLHVRVGKDRFGRVTSKSAVPLSESA